MLKVQEYFKRGGTLISLQEEYKIKVRVDDKLNVVCLNYDQLNSDLSEEICQECRALILDLDTYEVVSWPYRKFFKLGQVEVPVSFDWDNFTAFDKLDGSLISLWHHKEWGWQIATRSVPDANTNVNDTTLTFNKLVLMTLEDMKISFEELTSWLIPGYSYSCELTGPENQIVVEYKERCLTLTGIRELNNLQEFLPSEWVENTPGFPLPYADEYHGWNRELAESACFNLNPREREGYVLVDSFWNRVKIKSEAYCYLSNKRDSLSKSAKARLELILSEKDDDILPILPVVVQNQILEMKGKLSVLSTNIRNTYKEISSITNQKEFAMKALDYNFSAYLFQLRKSSDTLLDMYKKTTPGNVLKLLNYKEEENVDLD